MELKTLLLNPRGEAQQILSWQQAVVLLYKNKVHVLEEYEAKVSSPNVTIAVPSVLMLRRLKKNEAPSVKFSRPNVYERDKHRCCYCGLRKLARELTYDHVLPRSRGGKTVWENIVTSCKRCNTRKDRRTPAEAGMQMHFKPYVPTSLPHRPPLLETGSIPEAWKPYLGPQLEATG